MRSCNLRLHAAFPSKFDYVAARSVDEAIAAKATGDDVRFLAGGQLRARSRAPRRGTR